MSDKQRFIRINGEQIPVTEEVYRAYKRPLWAQRKRNERAKRCRDDLGRRCTANCRFCNELKKGSVLSLNQILEDEENLPMDDFDLSDFIEDMTLKDTLRTAISRLSEEEQRLVWVAFSGKSERNAAAELNLRRNTFVYRRDAVVKKLREILA